MSFPSHNSNQPNKPQGETNFVDRSKLEAKTSVVYEAISTEKNRDLNSIEAEIFIDLLTKEDPELQAELEAAYERSLTVETEVAQIESKEELEYFLALVESKAIETGYLDDPEWQAKARDVYESDRDFVLNQRIVRQREILEQAVFNIESGCKGIQDAVSNSISIAGLQSGCLLIIRGSYSLLSLTEKYHYPKQNWLRKILAKKLPMLEYARFRREERIKHICYLVDYLQQFAIALESNPTNLETRRLHGYLKALPLETNHLAEWLTEEIAKQQRIRHR